MARYIDEGDIYELFQPTGIARIHVAQIDELPRADVVPKSEVEKLQEAYNDRLAKDIQTNAEFVKYAKAEVAREIFEEIERAIKNYGICFSCPPIAELKKKYTEGNDE